MIHKSCSKDHGHKAPAERSAAAHSSEAIFLLLRFVFFAWCLTPSGFSAKLPCAAITAPVVCIARANRLGIGGIVRPLLCCLALHTLATSVTGGDDVYHSRLVIHRFIDRTQFAKLDEFFTDAKFGVNLWRNPSRAVFKEITD